MGPGPARDAQDDLRILLSNRCLSGQVAATHQVLVDSARALPALADRPDHQGLTPAHVTGGKHTVDRGLVGSSSLSDSGVRKRNTGAVDPFSTGSWKSRPCFADFSLHIPDMRVEIIKICPHSPAVSLLNTRV